MRYLAPLQPLGCWCAYMKRCARVVPYSCEPVLVALSSCNGEPLFCTVAVCRGGGPGCCLLLLYRRCCMHTDQNGCQIAWREAAWHM